MPKPQMLLLLFNIFLTQCIYLPIEVRNPGMRRITSLTGHWYGQPRLSPDGSRIAFYVADFPGDPKIYVLPSDASQVTQLPKPIGAGASPDWSPDGAKIVFSSVRSGTEQIYVMNSDGTSVVQVTQSPQEVGCPKWSPNGKAIAFCSGGSRTTIDDFQLYVMNADGSNVIQLTKFPLGRISRFEWSAGEERILFEAENVQMEKNKRPQSEIGPYLYLINPDGTNLARLDVGTTGSFFPTWSPDGRRVLFSYSGGRSEDPLASGYYLVNADGTERRLVLSEPSCTEPHWSHTGSLIVFVCGLGYAGNIFTMDMNTFLK